MQTRNEITARLIEIYPKLINARGYIFFGTLQQKPPYDLASYQTWRVAIEEDSDYLGARETIGSFLESLLANVDDLSPKPHGYVKIERATVTLHWTTHDVVETMLDNIDKVARLQHHYGFLGY